MPFLDKDGLAHFWNQIIARLNGKVEKEELDNLEASMIERIENIDLSSYETTIDAQSKLNEAKTYADEAVSTKANSSHNHVASDITSGTLSSDRLPTVPIAKGGTGATTAAGALTNLGLTATAAELNALDGITVTVTELNYLNGATSNIQTQIAEKSSVIIREW